MIDRVDIQYYQLSHLIQDIKHDSLENYDTVMMESIRLWFSDIDNLDKGTLTFADIKNIFIKKRGIPTSEDSEKTIYVLNWRDGKIEPHHPLIWESKNARLILTGSPDDPETTTRRFPYPTNTLFIRLENTSPILKNVFKTANELFLLEEETLLKQRVEALMKKDEENRKITRPTDI